jgi:hypothetical protein
MALRRMAAREALFAAHGRDLQGVAVLVRRRWLVS